MVSVTPGDRELMQRIAEGNKFAFRTLLTRHLPRAHAIARRNLASEQDAEEAVQDAFNKVWVNAPSFDPERAKFSTWFYRIVVNCCTDLLRRKPPKQEALEEWEEILPDTTQNQENAAMQQQEQKEIQRAVQSLPENQRMAVVLCYFEEMTNPQAAEAMNLHIKALEGLLVRARKTLRTLLIPHATHPTEQGEARSVGATGGVSPFIKKEAV